MGCDIHCYKEKQIGGKWLTADEWIEYDYGDDEQGMEVEYKKQFNDRNYNLFAILAGVRERETPPYKFEPRGMPIACSTEVFSANEKWDCDGHSHSYLYLHELKELSAFLDSTMQLVSGMKNVDELAALQASIDSGTPDWELLYPYCQGTNDPKQKKFAIEAPASFMVGDAVKRLISGFDGVEGENHRIVFWFDN
jgi:hypothetical protein